MAEYKVVDAEQLDAELTEIADKVRILTDTSDTMTIDRMTDNIAQANADIETQADLIAQIKTALEGKAAGSKEEQEKSVTIAENGTTEVLPDEGKTLSKVAVNVAIESGGGGTELFFSPQGRCYTKNLEIPEGIAMIGEFAFDKCDKLTLKNNRLPESLTTLGKQAFFSCSDMVLEKLPSNLSTIGDDSLSKTQFIGQEIPSTVKSIGNYAFANCTTINALYFKGKPNSIRENAFYYCSNIKHIYVPWAEGEVANAPWGATNTTIHYNSEV